MDMRAVWIAVLAVSLASNTIFVSAQGSCGSAGQPPCSNATGPDTCANGTYCQAFYSYGDPSNAVMRYLCLPVRTGMYTVGGPCDSDQSCTPKDSQGNTPMNQTLRCNYTKNDYTYTYLSKLPGNASYAKLSTDPTASDAAVAASVGTCVAFPADKCFQEYGPCANSQVGVSVPRGVPGNLYQECPDDTNQTCPSGFYCEGLKGSNALGYPWATCLEVPQDCGTQAGGVCCPEALGTMPSCPSSDLYCQVRGLQGASINDTYCLEMGSCGHEGQPGCNHTTGGVDVSTYVDTEKNAQDYSDGLRCEVGLYDNLGGVPQPNATSIYSYGICTANPADCGSEGKVACALPTSDDCCGYVLTCDEGLYVPNGELCISAVYNITTSVANVTVNALDDQSSPQLMYGSVNATMTCQTCPPDNSTLEQACKFGVPEGIRPGSAPAPETSST